MIRDTSWVAAFVLLSAATASAQSTELGVTGGFTAGVALDRHAPELDEVTIAGGFTFGFQTAYFLSPHWGLEAQWSEQFTGFDISAPTGSARLYDLSVSRLHGNAVYQLGRTDAAVRPYVIGGIGATFFRAPDLPSEVKLSWAVGGGIKYFPWKTIGLRAQARFAPTRLNDSAAGQYCDAFGFCQNALRQFDVAAGILVRF